MFKYLFKNHVSRLYLSTVLFCTAEYLRLCSMSGILLQNNKIRTQTLLLPLNGAPLCGGGTGVRGFSGGKAPAWLPGLCQEPSRPWVGRGAGASKPTPTSLARCCLGFSTGAFAHHSSLHWSWTRTTAELSGVPKTQPQAGQPAPGMNFCVILGTCPWGHHCQHWDPGTGHPATQEQHCPLPPQSSDPGKDRLRSATGEATCTAAPAGRQI